MWDLDCEEGWAPKNWCFWTVVLEKTLECPLHCKEIQPVHSLMEISPGISLEGMMLNLKLLYFGHLMRRVNSLQKTLMLGGIGGRRSGRQRMGWDGWMVSLTRWTWVWVNSGSWWWTGQPGVLWFMGSQRVGHDWATELNWLMHLWSLVTEGLTGPTSLNHLRTQPVHFPLMSSAFLTRVSGESDLTPVAVSTSALPLQGDSSLTEMWPESGDWGCNDSLMGQVHLVQDEVLPHLISGSCIHPQPAGFWDESGREMQSSPQRLQCRTAGTSPGRVSADWTV